MDVMTYFKNKKAIVKPDKNGYCRNSCKLCYLKQVLNNHPEIDECTLAEVKYPEECLNALNDYIEKQHDISVKILFEMKNTICTKEDVIKKIEEEIGFEDLYSEGFDNIIVMINNISYYYAEHQLHPLYKE